MPSKWHGPGRKAWHCRRQSGAGAAGGAMWARPPRGRRRHSTGGGSVLRKRHGPGRKPRHDGGGTAPAVVRCGAVRHHRRSAAWQAERRKQRPLGGRRSRAGTGPARQAATQCRPPLSSWANLIENRGPNRTNREPEPKEPEPRILIPRSVPNSQEPKFSVRFGSYTRLTEEPSVTSRLPEAGPAYIRQLSRT